MMPGDKKRRRDCLITFIVIPASVVGAYFATLYIHPLFAIYWLAMGMCYPMFVAFYSGYNPYSLAAGYIIKCKKHNYYHDTGPGCDYCRLNKQAKMK